MLSLCDGIVKQIKFMNTKAHEHSVEPLAMILLAVAALLAAFILLEVARLFATSAGAEQTVARALRPVPAGPSDTPQAGQGDSAVDRLKKNNLFVPQPAKEYPINEVIGILGSEALINGQWYKAGDNVGEAKILSIEPTKVKVVWNGQEKEFTPIGSTGAQGPGGPGPERMRERIRPPTAGPPTVVTGGASGPPGLSPEERDQLRERWPTMSPEERQRFRDEMRQRFGRRSR